MDRPFLIARWPATAFARYRPVWPVLRWVLFGAGLLFSIAAILALIPYGGRVVGEGVTMGDAHAYWSAGGNLYSNVDFRYSPAFYWATFPLRLLPWEVFAFVWFALHVLAILWLAPWMFAFPGVIDDAVKGNVNTFIALLIVLSLRHGWAYAPILLSKVTPGVGVVWYVVRREWRKATLAVGVTGVVVLLGAIVAPNRWLDWFRSLGAGQATYMTDDWFLPLPVRLVIAVGIVAYAARTERAWLIPVGLIVSVPGLWPSSFALLAAIPRLARWRGR